MVDDYKESNNNSENSVNRPNLFTALNIAKELAIEAGKGILTIYNKPDIGIQTKGDGSPLTQADLLANSIISNKLREKYPNFGLLTEEEKDTKERLTKEFVWIVDPLDGTKEFISKSGEFTVNIALVQNGKPIIGVIYVPVTDELYYALDKHGAYYHKNVSSNNNQNHIKINVNSRTKSEEMMVVKSKSHATGKLLNLLEKHQFKSEVSCGSSLKGCFVSNGNADVYFRFGPTNEWDICAMNCIINESSGIMTDTLGNPMRYNQETTLNSGFIASNNTIHNQLVEWGIQAEEELKNEENETVEVKINTLEIKQTNNKSERLRRLEAESIFVIREAYRKIGKVGVLWSMGKDSTVLLWLIKKAFLGTVPIPAIHIDTTFKFPEMYDFREKIAKEWKLNLMIGTNTDAINRGINYENNNALTVCHELKTIGLKNFVKEHQFEGLMLAIRADEEGSRSKERLFSKRDAKSSWDYTNQAPELWDQYNTDVVKGEHIRVHPILNWTEVDVWEYIKQENIPQVELYFAKEGKRYRSLGCMPITSSIDSNADTIDKIIQELKETNTAERDGRGQDKEDKYALQKLRAKGYM